jgi:hypothetical protein
MLSARSRSWPSPNWYDSRALNFLLFETINLASGQNYPDRILQRDETLEMPRAAVSAEQPTICQ